MGAPRCPLCGHELVHGWNVEDPWRCVRERGGCGAGYSGPRPVLLPVSDELLADGDAIRAAYEEAKAELRAEVVRQV
jgi:hypothetical protein